MSDIKYFLVFLFAVILAIGIWMLLKSPAWGLSEANNYLRTQAGGSMDSAQFNILVQSFQASYRWLGAILSGVGGAFFVCASVRIMHSTK